MAVAKNSGSPNSSRPRGETLIGDADENEIVGGDANDVIYGRAGDDVIDGGLGNDILRGEDGDDEITDNSGRNTIYGGAGTDRINGTGVIYGDAGNDVIVAGFGDNQISGGDGNDSITAGEGDDTINGGAGNDRIRAGAGDDVIEDSEGNNDINGGAGDDVIHAAGKMAGGRGDDTLTAANVASGDTYLFNKGDGHDEITDVGNDDTVDTLQFGNGIASAGAQVSRDGDDVVIKLGETDSVRIRDWFGQAATGTNNVMEFVRFANGAFWTPEAIQKILDSGAEGSKIIFGDEFDNILNGTEEGDIIHALGGNDTVHAKAGDDKVLAGTGNDTVYGGAGKDEIDGDEGDDILYGEAGDDVIRGGAGRDTIDGGEGNDQIHGAGTMTGGRGDDTITASDVASSDTYVFNSGDGRDVITDLGNNSTSDVLKLGAGISLDAVSMVRSGDDAIFRFGTGDEQVTVRDWFKLTEGERNQRLESVQFSNGGIWSDINFQQLLTGGVGTLSGTQLDDQITGSDANNTIYGNDGNDTIDGGAGNDTIQGGAGADTLDGGEGNDQLEGDDGDDTLRGGAGNDTLVGGNGVDDLDGGDGDDIVQGAGTLAGGKGIDTLIGTNLESGDTYKFNSGDGRDTIIDVGVATSSDKLQFGQGIVRNSIIMVRAGDDLILRMGENDQVRVQDWFKVGDPAQNHQIEDVIFGDGTKLTADEINKLFESIGGGGGGGGGGGSGGGETGVGTGGNDTLDGTENDDILYGMDGDDRIFGYGGNDQLHGGKGNDQLFGGTGDDTLNGDAGDDILDGDIGNDKLYGGAGNDKLYGGDGIDFLQDGDGINELNGGDGNDTIIGAGTFRGGKGQDNLNAVNGESNDTYLYASGDGWDTIIEQAAGSSSSTEDVLRFEDLASNNLWFVREGNDLRIHHMGTQGGMTVKSWFEGSSKQIESIFTNDGKVLTNDKVAALVQALAGFNPPPGGYAGMSAEQRRRYDAAVAGNWVTQSS